MKAALGIRAWLEHLHINGIRVECSPSGDNIHAHGEVPSLTLTLTARNVTWMSVHARSQEHIIIDAQTMKTIVPFFASG